MKMKKFLMPLLVLVIAAVISVVLYFVRIEIHKDWQTTIGTVTKVEVTTMEDMFNHDKKFRTYIKCTKCEVCRHVAKKSK